VRLASVPDGDDLLRIGDRLALGLGALGVGSGTCNCSETAL
jgi:hypothetical protein